MCVQDLVAIGEEELKLYIARKMRTNSNSHEFTRHLLRSIFMGNIQEANKEEMLLHMPHSEGVIGRLENEVCRVELCSFEAVS